MVINGEVTYIDNNNVQLNFFCWVHGQSIFKLTKHGNKFFKFKVDFNQNELDKARIVNEVNDAAAGTPVDGQAIL